MDPPSAARFPCSRSGAIASGRRRLGLLLALLAAVMAVLGAVAFSAGRFVPGLACAGVLLVLWTAWRMSGDLEPIWLEPGAERLLIGMRRRQMSVAVDPHAARRLEADEIAYLERLATTAGITVATGGFDSTRLGEFDLYASNLDNAVLLAAGETAVVVTPDDPEAFLVALRSASDTGDG